MAGASCGRPGSPRPRSTAGSSGPGEVPGRAWTLLAWPLRSPLGLGPRPSGRLRGQWPCSDSGHPARPRPPPGPPGPWRTGHGMRGSGLLTGQLRWQPAGLFAGRGLCESRHPLTAHHEAPHGAPQPSLPTVPVPALWNCPPGYLRLQSLVADQPSASGALLRPPQTWPSLWQAPGTHLRRDRAPKTQQSGSAVFPEIKINVGIKPQ